MKYTQSIKGKLFKYFTSKLRIKKSTKGWWRCDCFNCGGNYTFGIQIESFKTHCFKCGYYSNPIGLLMKLEGFEQVNEARKFLDIQQEYDAYERIAKVEKKVTESLDLPESFTLLMQGDSMIAKAARHYMRKRGFNIKKLSLHGVGYCSTGEYAGYIIFPYYRKGKLVYMQGRVFMGGGPKMKNPDAEKYGIGKSSLIYNEDALFIYNRIYAMESITNCLTLGDLSIGLSGKTISPMQLTKIIQSPCKSIVIILDDDALSEAYKFAMQVVHYKKVKVVHMPKGKDVNDLGKKKTMELVKKTPYSNYIDLLKGKNKINGKTTITSPERGKFGTSARGY